MKYKTTKKDVMNGYFCHSIGYCGACELLRGMEPESYTCGVYGWNADIYRIPGTDHAIVTGYRPFGSSVDYKTERTYERMASKVNHNYEKSWEEREIELDSIRNEFFDFITGKGTGAWFDEIVTLENEELEKAI